MATSQSTFHHVTYAWNDDDANQLDPVERLVYRSNLLGADGRITNTGGGNTSSKIIEPDPLTGEPVEVLWVKGSGGALRRRSRPRRPNLWRAAIPGVGRSAAPCGLRRDFAVAAWTSQSKQARGWNDPR